MTMLTMKSVLTVEVNGRNYEFNCQPDSPLPDAIEAHTQVGAFLLGKQEQNKAAAAKAQEAPDAAPDQSPQSAE